MNEIIKTKNGLDVNKINGFLTHSLYDPVKEAKKFVKKHIEDVQIHIIYGYGSGYIVNEFVKNNPFNTVFIVIDPFINIEKLEDTDFVKYIYLKEVEEFHTIIKPFISKIENNIKFTCSLNYDKMNEKIYKEILINLKESISVNKVIENTVLCFSYLWLENYLQNLNYKDSSVIKLANITDKPVIVASGGPSLNKQLPLLKKYRNDFIVISAGSTTNSLVQADIIPDFVVSVDGHELNYKHFEHLQFNEEVVYVYSMYSYPEIRNRFEKGFYFLDGTGQIVLESLREIKKEEPVIFFGGGSVAHYALILADYISSGPIGMIGQDLAYLDGYTHAKNNILGKKVTIEEQKDLLEVTGYYGDKVYTDHMLLSMKQTFEKLINHIEENKVFNCTEGGVLIEGIQNKCFKDFCSENILKTNCLIELPNSINEVQENTLDITEKNIKKYKKIKSVVEENILLISLAKKKMSFTKEILRKMNANDKIIKKLSDKDIIAVALQTISIKIQKGFKKEIDSKEDENFKKSIAENEFLYLEMKKTLDFALETLQKNIESLEV